MAPGLRKWVQEKYQTIGIDKDGIFIGEELFTCKLIGYYGSTEGAQALDQKSWKNKLDEIRRLVNT
jgi:hypothetical protein